MTREDIVAIDSDGNPATGDDDIRGAEYLLEVEPTVRHYDIEKEERRR